MQNNHLGVRLWPSGVRRRTPGGLLTTTPLFFFAPLGLEGFRSLSEKTDEILGSTVLVDIAQLARLLRAFCFQFSFTQAVLLHARAR